MKNNADNSSQSQFWKLFKSVLVFQFRLLMDGVRDLLLSPLAIVLALIGLVLKPNNPGIYFNQLMRFGRKTDVWINLFEMREHYEGEEPDAPSSNEYIKKLEALLAKEYQRGGLVKNLKDGTDELLGRIRPDK